MRLPRAHRPFRVPRARSGARSSLAFLRAVYEKAARDEIFFLSSGITFNVLICFVPLLLLGVSALGYVVASSTDAYLRTLELLQRALPLSSEDVQGLLVSLVPERGRLGLLGALVLVWASTRLFGSLRTVLFVIFELEDEHRMGIVESKIHDVKMVVVVGLFFVVSMALTTIVSWLGGLTVPGVGRFGDLQAWPFLAGVVVIFLITLAMFYLLYRYLPSQAISRDTALVAALVSGILFELAKYLFVGVLARVVNFAIYGQFSTLILVLVWAYYSAVVFILGGEIAWLLRCQPAAEAARRRPFRRAPAAGEAR